MRPLELRLRNFRSYFGDDAVFDFRERNLVGVVGPIGSGKSSLLDAIAFALFGRTPAVGSSTKSLIHQRADGATVNLRFAVDAEVWEVTRALRRKGQSVHGLIRLADDSPDAAKVETFVLESEVNEKIGQLLGLEFDGFSRSVMLAQGRFAEFLNARPAERDKVLKGVFGHEKIDHMRAHAKERAAAEALRAETLGVRLEAAEALAGRLAESKEKLATAEEQLELLRKAEAKVADHNERADATGRIISHAEARLAELAPIAAQIPAAQAVAEIVRLADTANETRQRLGAALEAARQELVSADGALAALDPQQLRRRIEEAGRLEAIRSQLESQRASLVEREAAGAQVVARLTKRVTKAETALEAATADSAAAADAVEAAGTAHELAAQRLHTVEHANMAGALRRRLGVGEPCPVCEQAVRAVPEEVELPAAAQAEAEVAAAKEELQAVRSAQQSASDRVAQYRAEVAALHAEIAGAEKEAAAIAAQLTAMLEQVEATQAALFEICGEDSSAVMRAALEAAELTVTEARKRADLARSEHDEAIRAAQAADKELGSLRLTLTELAARLSVEIGPIDAGKEVAAAVDQVRASWEDETQTLTTAKVAAEQEQAEIAAAARELHAELGIEGDFATHLAGVVASIEVRRQQIAEDESTLGEADEIRGASAAAIRQRQIYESLAADLTDSRFVRFLLDEEKRGLANLGSEHFERLSSGRYRFSTDGEFRVVDLTSADAVRKADSLSGGETFLASLALALALAEMVARTGGRLDAFFLDEGFGTLDPEHLDLAMEGIEQLAADASDRLLLVVSHVPAMRHRLEDLIELDRNPVTGDTVVIRA